MESRKAGSERRMKVLAVVPSIYDTNPGQRYRIEQWEPYLKCEGIDLEYASFEDEELHRVLYQSGGVGKKINLIARGFRRRRQLLARLKEFDAIYLFREAALLGPPWIERRLAASGVPMVFDFDDAIFIPYRSPANGYLSYLKFPAKTAEVCRIARHVMAGNQYLADYAHRTQQNVTIIPTTIDTTKYVPSATSGNGVPVIGWTGSYSTVQHLDRLRSVLQELRRAVPFRLRVICSAPYRLEGIEVENILWTSAQEVADLAGIDVGIMPLPEDRWSKGKCGCKALQYMAVAKPAVCSPVGVNTEIIRDGENGLLANTDEEWIAALSRLLASASLRKTMGEKARKTVEERFSARCIAPKVAEIFKHVAGN